MKKVFFLLIVISLNLALFSNNTEAQMTGVKQPTTNTVNNNTASNTTVVDTRRIRRPYRGLRRLDNLEKQRLRTELRKERLENQRLENQLRREEAVKRKTSANEVKKKNLSTQEKISPRPSAGPVDLNGHKKTINGHEVTVVEMEPIKNK